MKSLLIGKRGWGLGVMSGDSVLESVDWRSIHSILEKAKGGSPR
jgi:hypothetical protein